MDLPLTRRGALARCQLTPAHLVAPLQMGMGKTACAVGAIQMNPPPADWRANRSYQKLRLRDHLCELAGAAPCTWPMVLVRAMALVWSSCPCLPLPNLVAILPPAAPLQPPSRTTCRTGAPSS